MPDKAEDETMREKDRNRFLRNARLGKEPPQKDPTLLNTKLCKKEKLDKKKLDFEDSTSRFYRQDSF